ncbi:MAG: hypothetical protein ABSD46_01700 [Bacteroidota bacterium]
MNHAKRDTIFIKELTAKFMASIGRYKIERTSMNLFRLVHIERFQRGSPIPHKRDRDRVPLCNNGTDLAPIR